MPAGRPTLYKPEFCDRVVQWGRDGKSRTWMAAKLGVCRDTMYAWEDAHTEFSDALKRAKALEQMWWEDKGQQGLEADRFQQQVWGRSMAARFPDDWRERTENKQEINPSESFSALLSVMTQTPVFPKDDDGEGK